MVRVISRCEAILRLAVGETNIFKAELENLFLDPADGLRIEDLLKDGDGVVFLLWEKQEGETNEQ